MPPIQQKKAAAEFAAFWQPLFERFNIHIDFAYRTFRWDSEADIKAHQDNDRAVMAAYGFSPKLSEAECVAELFKMYQELTK